MATRVTIPYFAPADSLPAPLPTAAEIAAARRLHTYRGGRKVFPFNQHFVVKYCKTLRTFQEAESTLFVASQTNIPVPTIYAMFRDEDEGFNVVVEEYIQGKNLDKCWASLDDDAKADAAAQIRSYVDQLRAIPAPGYYGGIWRQPIPHALFRLIDLDDEPDLVAGIGLPYETEHDFVENCICALTTHAVEVGGMITPDRGEFLRRAFHDVFRNHRPVFAHGDLSYLNIKRRDDGTLALFDWENAGWYPDFWEYAWAMLITRYEDDWHKWVPHMMEEYFAELGWLGQFLDAMRLW